MKHATKHPITQLALFCALITGCPEESSPDQNDTGDDVGDGGPSDSAGDAGQNAPASTDAKVGTFTLRLVPPAPASGGSAAVDGYTAISGKVFAGEVPEEVAWDVDLDQGGCQLLKPRVPFCDPGCGADVCVDDDKCQPNPKAVSVGTISLSGLKGSSGSSSELKIEPIAASYSTPADSKLAYPPFEEGAEVKLSAPGGDAGAFTLTSHGIAPLTLTTTNFALKSGSAFALAWKAPSKSDLTRVEVKLDISHHGGTKGKIVCDVPDNGALSIPADLVTRLLSLGVSGFPTIVVDRVSSGSAKIAAGNVELRVISELETAVQIDGLTSCDDNSDCGEGKTCKSDLSCSK